VGAYDLALGPYSLEEKPSQRLEGRISRHAYRVPIDRNDTFAIYTRLRDALVEQGYSALYQCSDSECGGFDFRFGIDVLPPPDMEVDLTDFHFGAFERDDENSAHVALFVSRDTQNGFVQIDEIIPNALPEVELEQPPVQVAEEQVELQPSDWSADLERSGRAVLEGVSFETGQTKLTEDSMGVIEKLAEFLSANPDLSLLIVGHSDNIGSLEANIGLSRSRAEAVRQALISEQGIDAARLESAGAGYLSPRVPNTTEEGRALNRRVEIVLK
jgi:OmpA-OmpF porin, OOP family